MVSQREAGQGRKEGRAGGRETGGEGKERREEGERKGGGGGGGGSMLGIRTKGHREGNIVKGLSERKVKDDKLLGEGISGSVGRACQRY